MQEWTIDLHIHSLLSPCAHEDMVPEAVMDKAIEKGIDVIAITDHNSCGNVEAFVQKGLEKGVIVVPGMELQTQEDIHLVCLFDKSNQAFDFEKELEPYFLSISNDTKRMGEQWLVDKEGNRIEQEHRLLLSSLKISIDKAVEMVHKYEGICIAAHVDRAAFSVYAVFGVLPDNIPFDGIELTCHLERPPMLIKQIRDLGYNYITASDAHYLNHINDIHCAAFLDHWSVDELKQAMRGENGRQLKTIR